MTTTRREPPDDLAEEHDWFLQGVRDLAAGRHAVGCECSDDLCEVERGNYGVRANSCTTIARCLRDFVAYEIEA